MLIYFCVGAVNTFTVYMSRGLYILQLVFIYLFVVPYT